MDSLEVDLDRLEEIMRLFFQTMKRPVAWENITARAGVKIDRPAAGILHVLMAEGSASYRLHDLAEHLGVESPSVTRKTQELEKAGLIRRQRHKTDRRAVELTVTARGREVGNRLWQARREITADVLSNWPVKDRQQFILLFERYSQDLFNSAKQPPN